MAETLSSLADLKTVDAVAGPDAPVHVQKLDKYGRAYATGKRKDAVARVWRAVGCRVRRVPCATACPRRSPISNPICGRC